jgi:hypothetical protein
MITGWSSTMGVASVSGEGYGGGRGIRKTKRITTLPTVKTGATASVLILGTTRVPWHTQTVSKTVSRLLLAVGWAASAWAAARARARSAILTARGRPGDATVHDLVLPPVRPKVIGATPPIVMQAAPRTWVGSLILLPCRARRLATRPWGLVRTFSMPQPRLLQSSSNCRIATEPTRPPRARRQEPEAGAAARRASFSFTHRSSSRLRVLPRISLDLALLSTAAR